MPIPTFMYIFEWCPSLLLCIYLNDAHSHFYVYIWMITIPTFIYIFEWCPSLLLYLYIWMIPILTFIYIFEWCLSLCLIWSLKYWTSLPYSCLKFGEVGKVGKVGKVVKVGKVGKVRILFQMNQSFRDIFSLWLYEIQYYYLAFRALLFVYIVKQKQKKFADLKKTISWIFKI